MSRSVYIDITVNDLPQQLVDKLSDTDLLDLFEQVSSFVNDKEFTENAFELFANLVRQNDAD